jgi:hypothetical protein
MLLHAISFIYFLQAFFISATCKFISSSDGTNIYANAIGSPLNPSLVFIHGFMLSDIVFDGVLQDPRMLSQFYLVGDLLRIYRLEGSNLTLFF